MAELKDSGQRRQFETGAVRDVADGKGRCDLLPFTEIACFLRHCKGFPYPLVDIFDEFEEFERTLHPMHIYTIIDKFCLYYQIDARAESDPVMTYYSCPSTMILELAKHFEDGAKKYPARNWQHGMPWSCFVDSGTRHLLKVVRGDTDEPHQRAFLWNMFGLLWTMEHYPEMNDMTEYVDIVCPEMTPLTDEVNCEKIEEN